MAARTSPSTMVTMSFDERIDDDAFRGHRMAFVAVTQHQPHKENRLALSCTLKETKSAT